MKMKLTFGRLFLAENPHSKPRIKMKVKTLRKIFLKMRLTSCKTTNILPVTECKNKKHGMTAT